MAAVGPLMPHARIDNTLKNTTTTARQTLINLGLYPQACTHDANRLAENMPHVRPFLNDAEPNPPALHGHEELRDEHDQPTGHENGRRDTYWTVC